MKRADTRPLLHHPPNAPSREINYDHQEPPSGQGSYHREGPEKGIGTGLLHQHPFHLPPTIPFYTGRAVSLEVAPLCALFLGRQGQGQGYKVA